MNGIIEISRLGERKDYSLTEAFQPRWENVLLMTAYDRELTYVLTTDREELLIPRRLREVLRDFGEYAGVHKLEMQILYNLVRGKTRGIVAGNFALVPTCGQGNCQVVYYMAHHLDNYQQNHHNQRLLLTFKGTNRQLISAEVDCCYKTFERLLNDAHEVGKIQLESVKNLCHCFGIRDELLNHFCGGTTSHEQRLHRLQYERVFLDQISRVVQETAMKCYSEDLTEDFYRQLRRILDQY